MTLSIRCPGCGSALNAPPSAAGKKVRCPRCQAAVPVPEPEVVDAEPVPGVQEEPEPQRPARTPAAVRQPLLPPIDPARRGNPFKKPPAPVWKRELYAGMVWLGVMGALLVLSSVIGLVFWRYASREMNAPRPAEPAKSSQAELDELLDALGGLDAGRRKQAAERLARAEPNIPRRGEVAKALARCLGDRDQGTAQAAARALVGWATPEVVPELAAGLAGESRGVREDCLRALERLQDPRAAGEVAACLAKPERGLARKVLERMGGPAEPAVRPYLKHADAAVRREACAVLGKVGTPDSRAALEAARDGDPDRGVQRAARAALAAIGKRQG
jgi:hypothetical protein